MSSMGGWAIKDGTFDLHILFNNLVMLFKDEDTDEEWVEDTLTWWNMYIVLP